MTLFTFQRTSEIHLFRNPDIEYKWIEAEFKRTERTEDPSEHK